MKILSINSKDLFSTILINIDRKWKIIGTTEFCKYIVLTIRIKKIAKRLCVVVVVAELAKFQASKISGMSREITSIAWWIRRFASSTDVDRGDQRPERDLSRRARAATASSRREPPLSLLGSETASSRFTGFCWFVGLLA